MWTYEQLLEIEKLPFLPALTEEQEEHLRIKEENEKELERLEAKLDRMLEKRRRMLFCAGVTNTASEAMRDRCRTRLEKTKAWRGNEYDIANVRKNIEYINRDLGKE